MLPANLELKNKIARSSVIPCRPQALVDDQNIRTLTTTLRTLVSLLDEQPQLFMTRYLCLF